MPRLASWMVRRCLPARLAEEVLGDIEERWRRERRTRPVGAWWRATRLALVVSARALADRARPLEAAPARGSRFASLGQDVRYAGRLLRRQPAMATAMVLTLAVGTGAATGLFSVVNSWLLRPMPFADPDRLVAVWETIPTAGIFENTPAPVVFHDWRARATSFDGLAPLTRQTRNLTGQGEPERLSTLRVAPAVIDVLGLRPAAGRLFRAEDGIPPAPKVVLLSYVFWRDRYGAAPSAVGQMLRLDGESFEVIGVLPEGAHPYGMDVDLWTPLAFTASEAESGNRMLWVLGRLKPGVSVERASAEVDRIALERSSGDTGGRAVGLRDQTVGSTRGDVIVLFGAAALVMLIACANVASLTLAQVLGRRSELAARQALGATRGRLMRQVLVEHLTLGALGGAGGLLIAMWSARGLASLAPAATRLGAVDVFDARVFAFAALVTIATSVVFGLLPAWSSRGGDLATVLRDSGRTASRGRRRTFSALVVAEIAVAFVLLVATVLVARSLRSLSAIDLGFATEQVVMCEVPRAGAEASRAFFAGVERGLLAAPGVEGVAMSQGLPLLAVGSMGSGFAIEGRTTDASVLAYWRVVNPRYFDGLAIPILNGRGFTDLDRDGSPLVAVVSQSFARRAWPGGDGVGRRIGWGTLAQPITVVGIAADIRQTRAIDPGPHVYMPYLQAGDRPPTQLAVRSTLAPPAVVDLIRRVVRDLDPAQPVAGIVTAEQQLWRSTSRRRFHVVLFSLFAAVALLLSAVGVHGVLSFLLAERRRELGIRAALGATPGQLQRTWIGVGLRMIAGGLAIGALAAWWTSDLMRGFLFNIAPRDGAAFAAAFAVIAAAAAAACLIPAARAARVDPIEPLRE
ncbi:MAG TPA: ABC transporter permease [Vicinamibacterales bacterium]|nr:ABC transporter permease [Vicinamibacterales bacterium]